MPVTDRDLKVKVNRRSVCDGFSLITGRRTSDPVDLCAVSSVSA
jgi:hypothetical protein